MNLRLFQEAQNKIKYMVQNNVMIAERYYETPYSDEYNVIVDRQSTYVIN